MKNLDLYKIYIPITSVPFEQTEAYTEIAPCDALKPYIRCFWGSANPHIKSANSRLVIPDTCMDIIFNIDFTNNTVQSSFFGIDDRSFCAYKSNDDNALISTFAIRFYPWSVSLFAEDSISDVQNRSFDTEHHFSKLKKSIEPLLFDIVNIKDRIKITESYLLNNIHKERINTPIITALDMILSNSGNIKVTDISKELHLSTRHIERLFENYISISPKKLCSLVRYQYLWQEVLFNKDFNILDSVCKYGYTDQSHLMREFKKYHTMTIAEAKAIALNNVAFLQDSQTSYV